MKIDITTGDEITPRAINYEYKTILDDDVIEVVAYNCETILAEKYETIIRRNSSAKLTGRVQLEGLRIYLRVSANKKHL